MPFNNRFAHSAAAESSTYLFNHRAAVVEQLKKISKQEVLDHFRRFVLRGGDHRRLLAALIRWGKQPEHAGEGDGSRDDDVAPAKRIVSPELDDAQAVRYLFTMSELAQRPHTPQDRLSALQTVGVQFDESADAVVPRIRIKCRDTFKSLLPTYPDIALQLRHAFTQCKL